MSVEYRLCVGRYTAYVSTDHQLTVGRQIDRQSVAIASVEYRPSVGRVSAESIGRHPVDRVDRSTPIGRHLSVEYQSTLSADTRPISRPILDRHSGWHSGEMSSDTCSSVCRHVLQVGRPSVATIERYLSVTIGRYLSLDTYRSTPVVRVSTDTIGRHSRPILDRHSGETTTDTSSSVCWHDLQVGRPSVDTIAGRLSVDTYRSTPAGRYLEVNTYRSTPVGRVSTDTIGRHLADISTDTQPTSRPTFGRDVERHLVECWPTCSPSW